MAQPRYFTAAEIRAALPMRVAIDAMREAFGALASGRVTMPPRMALSAGADATLLLMAARSVNPGALGTKLVSVFPNNRHHGLPAVQALVVMFDPDTGTPRSLFDGTAITAIRTGAASGLATELLARPDAHRVTLLGAGVQSRTQFEAVCAVRPVDSVAIWSRSRDRALALAHELRVSGTAPDTIRVSDSPADASHEADIICCATPASVPFLLARDVAPGTHVNAVGSFTPAMCEFEPSLLSGALTVVDQREAALDEAGEIVRALEEGHVRRHQLIELGTIVNGTARGRTTPAEITVFKSVGLAIQDLAACIRVERAH